MSSTSALLGMKRFNIISTTSGRSIGGVFALSAFAAMRYARRTFGRFVVCVEVTS
jgi:hypothetical protein